MKLKQNNKENTKQNRSERTKIKKILKQVKGITLIALVVTIIVLLILAGVALNLTIGQNGVFQRAQEAANTWRNATNNEELEMDSLSELMEIYQYKIEVPIPDKFYYVGGTKDSGIVISDNKQDENKYKDYEEVPADDLLGNQFVWIPVNNSSIDNFNKIFQRQEGYLLGSSSIQSMLALCSEVNAQGINNVIEETEITKAEAIEMYNSVYKYGGFYVGRFEVGKDKNNKVVIKKGNDENQVYPYTNISWSANGKMQETSGIEGGAVEISRNFDTLNNYTGVTTTLIYGVQWDAIMNFIDPNYITNAEIGKPKCENDSIVSNGTNYSAIENSMCGSSDNSRVKNIYDLAGSVGELTMESYKGEYRIIRGSPIKEISASYRINVGPNYKDNGITGFRIALYL